MSLKPPLSCPPDYSILVFRLTECKKAGVVKGITTEASLDLNDLNIPIQFHSEGTLVLKGNSTKLLNIDEIAEYGPLKEKFNFGVSLINFPDVYDDGVSYSYTLNDVDLNPIATISFTIDVSDPDYEDFPTAFSTAVSNSVIINSKVTIAADTALSTGYFTINANTAGIKYRHVFTFDTASVTTLTTYLHPGTLLTPYTKYEKGRVKYILIYPEYNKVDVSTCGCADSSGDIRSNQKYFQWVNRGEYDDILNPETPIFLDGAGLIGDVEIDWLSTSTDHIGYHLKTNDLFSTVETPLYRAFITNVDGYVISMDQPATSDMLVSGQQAQHTYSPNSPRYNNVGDFLFLSGATDINDPDRCFIETIMLKNPHSFDIPMKYMIGR